MNLAVCSATSEQAITVANLAGSLHLHMPASSKTDNEEKQCSNEMHRQKES